jgi:hypothetical protein
MKVSSNESVTHVWDESVASRCADEISLCLLNYCNKKVNDADVRVINACLPWTKSKLYKVILLWMYEVCTTSVP